MVAKEIKNCYDATKDEKIFDLVTGESELFHLKIPLIPNLYDETVFKILTSKKMDLIIDEILNHDTMNDMDLRREDFVSLYATTPSVIDFVENSIEETDHT